MSRKSLAWVLIAVGVFALQASIMTVRLVHGYTNGPWLLQYPGDIRVNYATWDLPMAIMAADFDSTNLKMNVSTVFSANSVRVLQSERDDPMVPGNGWYIPSRKDAVCCIGGRLERECIVLAAQENPLLAWANRNKYPKYKLLDNGNRVCPPGVKIATVWIYANKAYYPSSRTYKADTGNGMRRIVTHEMMHAVGFDGHPNDCLDISVLRTEPDCYPNTPVLLTDSDESQINIKYPTPYP